jgi:DNA-binding transcriptional LysR family regulator
MDRLAVMRTFVRVVDTGSFSAAARDLNIGQSAVSKAIVQLEERLGVLLLMRSTQRLVLTEAGEYFCEGAVMAASGTTANVAAAHHVAGPCQRRSSGAARPFVGF